MSRKSSPINFGLFDGCGIWGRDQWNVWVICRYYRLLWRRPLNRDTMGIQKTEQQQGLRSRLCVSYYTNIIKELRCHWHPATTTTTMMTMMMMMMMMVKKQAVSELWWQDVPRSCDVSLTTHTNNKTTPTWWRTSRMNVLIIIIIIIITFSSHYHVDRPLTRHICSCTKWQVTAELVYGKRCVSLLHNDDSQLCARVQKAQILKNLKILQKVANGDALQLEAALCASAWCEVDNAIMDLFIHIQQYPKPPKTRIVHPQSKFYQN